MLALVNAGTIELLLLKPGLKLNCAWFFFTVGRYRDAEQRKKAGCGVACTPFMSVCLQLEQGLSGEQG